MATVELAVPAARPATAAMDFQALRARPTVATAAMAVTLAWAVWVAVRAARVRTPAPRARPRAPVATAVMVVLGETSRRGLVSRLELPTRLVVVAVVEAPAEALLVLLALVVLVLVVVRITLRRTQVRAVAETSGHLAQAATAVLASSM